MNKALLIGIALPLFLMSANAQSFTQFNIDPNGAALCQEFREMNGMFYFAAFSGTPGLTGIYGTDGTVTGTSQISTAVTGTNLFIYYINALDNSLLFQAKATDNDTIAGAELWISDGTAAGTAILKDINPGAAGSFPMVLTRMGNQMFFSADDGTHGSELWVSDGTSNGTQLVKDINIGTAASFFGGGAVLNGELIFSAESSTEGREVWKTDGTTAGTVLLNDIIPGTSGSYPGNFHVLGNNVVFTATGPNPGSEIWVTDGTTNGTVLLKDINPGAASQFSFGFKRVDNMLFFYANDGSTGNELWVTDGTTSGTMQVKDINPGMAFSDPFNSTALNGELLFSARDGVNGNELWKSNGTAAGTVLVSDINPGASDGLPNQFAAYNNHAYFTAAPNGSDRKFFKTDGATTTELAPAGSSFSSPFALGFLPSNSVFNNAIFFTADFDGTGADLWSYQDGSVSIDDSYIGSSSIIAYPNPTNGKLFVDYSEIGANPEWSLTDMQGRTLPVKASQNENILELSLTAYPVGFYLLHLNFEGTTQTTKVLKF